MILRIGILVLATVLVQSVAAQSPHTHQHSFGDAEKWAHVFGYFAARLANMLPQGTVYAVDIEPDMVRYLGERAKREGLQNLKPIGGNADDTRLPAKVDLILLVDVYHHIDNRERYFRKLAASLKPGGRLAVIDFRLDSPEGPPKAARIAPERVKAELVKAGYVLEEEHGFLPHQYFLVFTPSRDTGRAPPRAAR